MPRVAAYVTPMATTTRRRAGSMSAACHVRPRNKNAAHTAMASWVTVIACVSKTIPASLGQFNAALRRGMTSTRLAVRVNVPTAMIKRSWATPTPCGCGVSRPFALLGHPDFGPAAASGADLCARRDLYAGQDTSDPDLSTAFFDNSRRIGSALRFPWKQGARCVLIDVSIFD